MAVELHVLSGSLQGRCLRFEGHRIVVGDVTAADLRFDPDSEAAARGQNAVLTLDEEEGWRIANEGAGVWLVNQTVLDRWQSHRLRSEDLVRVSERGPDLRFRLVSGTRGSPVPPAASANGASTSLPESSWRDDAGGTPAPQGAGVTPKLRGSEDDGRQEPIAEESSNLASPRAPLPCERERSLPRAALKRKKTRQSCPVIRLIGVVVSGLLGLACAYGLACWLGGEKNDVLHIFYSAPSPSTKVRGEP
jgi:hypothetical protein